MEEKTKLTLLGMADELFGISYLKTLPWYQDQLGHWFFMLVNAGLVTGLNRPQDPPMLLRYTITKKGKDYLGKTRHS